MIDMKRELFHLFGRLDTWVVGIQYHDGAKGLDSPEVYFDREPENPFDANAVAVFTRDGRQIGHLPRYDAAYFSPLIADGAVALRGQVGKSDRGDRLSLVLEIYATSKASEILVRDPRNDWRAIYHNLFISVWERLGEYSSATLEEFRNRFRPLAHEQALYPKTQFLYRMLKAYIADLEKQEETYWYQMILAAVERAVREQPDDANGAGRTAEEVKTAILETLAKAACSMTGTEEEGGGTRIDIRAGEFAGNALYRGEALARLRIREADPEIVCDKPRPTYQPKRLNAGN